MAVLPRVDVLVLERLTLMKKQISNFEATYRGRYVREKDPIALDIATSLRAIIPNLDAAIESLMS